MNSWFHCLTLEFAVVAIALLVLLSDALLSIPGRALGWFTALALGGLLVASYFVDQSGSVDGGAFVSNAWVAFFERVFLGAGILGTLGAIEWLARRAPRRQAEYYALLLFSLVGMMLLAGARDWALLVVSFELMSIPLYVLSAYAKSDGPASEPKLAAEAGFKLFITGAASSAFTFFGLALVVGASGTTKLGAMASGDLAPLTSLGMLMILAGFGFKVGAVPFHMWVPDTYQGAPLPFVAFLSVAPKAAGLVALMVVTLGSWANQHSLWGPAIAAIAVASMAVGNFFALPQTDVRRLLGFSGIAQIGYVLLALCAGTQQSIGMALFFVVSYLFTNFGLFLVVHAAADASGGHSLAKLAGLSRRSPWLGAALLVFLLSLAGVPFVVGFWAKLFVLMAAYQAGLVGLVVAGVALTVVALFYYLSVARSTFMSEGDSSAPVASSFSQRAAILVCLAGVVVLGLWPGPLVEQAARAAGALLSAP